MSEESGAESRRRRYYGGILRIVIDLARRLDIPADWAPALNPATLEAQKRSRELALSLGLLRGETAIARYDGSKFGLLAGYVFRSADADVLTLLNDFLTYFFHVDDRVEEERLHEGKPLSLTAYLSSHVCAFQDGLLKRPTDPASQLMMSVRERARQRMTDAWIERCSESLRDYLLRGTMVGAVHAATHSTRRVKDYLQYRAYDSGAFCAQDLIELAASAELPPHVHADEHFQALRRACTDVIAISNDLYSYAKELEQRSPNNLLAVLMHHEGLSLAHAIEWAITMVNERVRLFVRLRDSLPSYGRATDQRVAKVIEGQQAWMRGSHLWSLQTARYASSSRHASVECLKTGTMG